MIKPLIKSLMNPLMKGLFYQDDIDVNQPPIITSTPVLAVTEDTGYTYTLTATDADGDALTFSAVTIPSWATFVPATGVLSGTPDNGDVGSYSVELTVSDGQSTVTQSFSIEVAEQIATPDRFFTRNGTGGYIDLVPVTFSGDGYVQFKFVTDSAQSFQVVAATENHNTAGSGFIRLTSLGSPENRVVSLMVGSVEVQMPLLSAFNNGLLHTGLLVREGTEWTLSVNGVFQSTADGVGLDADMIFRWLGRIGVGQNIDGTMSDIIISSGGTEALNMPIDGDYSGSSVVVNEANNSANGTFVNQQASVGYIFDGVDTWESVSSVATIVVATQTITSRFFTTMGATNNSLTLNTQVTLPTATQVCSFEFDFVHTGNTINQVIASTVSGSLEEFFRYNIVDGVNARFMFRQNGSEDGITLSTSLNDGLNHKIKFLIDMPTIELFVDGVSEGTVTNANWFDDIVIGALLRLHGYTDQDFEGRPSNFIFKAGETVIEAFPLDNDISTDGSTSSSITANTATLFNAGAIVSNEFSFDEIKTWTPVSAGTAFDNAPQA